MIKAAQVELSWRPGVSCYTVIALEKGGPKVGVGTVFEAATIVGIPLLGYDQRELNQLATIVASLMSILPKRGRHKKAILDDDFQAAFLTGIRNEAVCRSGNSYEHIIRSIVKHSV